MQNIDQSYKPKQEGDTLVKQYTRLIGRFITSFGFLLVMGSMPSWNVPMFLIGLSLIFAVWMSVRKEDI